jgi:hypothetical protein
MPGLLVLLWLPNRCWLKTDTIEIRATWTRRLNVGLDLKTTPWVWSLPCPRRGFFE